MKGCLPRFLYLSQPVHQHNPAPKKEPKEAHLISGASRSKSMCLNKVTRCARLSLSLSYMKYCGHSQEPQH